MADDPKKPSQATHDVLWVVATLGLSAFVQVLVILRQWVKQGWNPDAPVPMRLFLLVAVIQLLAMMGLLVKMIWFNYALAVLG